MTTTTTPAYVQAMTALTQSLVGETGPESNTVVSGASAWLALALLGAGSNGDTAAGFDDLLGADGEDLAILHREVAETLVAVAGVRRASALWTRVPLHQEFLDSFPDVHADTRVDQAVLDEWVARATRGLFRSFPVAVTDQTMLALADAVAIQATWATSFETANTAPRRFVRADGSQDPVPTMSGGFPVSSITRANDIAVWEQPASGAGQGRPCVVRFAIGKSKHLDREDVLRATLTPRPPRQEQGLALVLMPKFALSHRTDLVPLLERSLAADSLTERADFSGLSPPLYLNSAAQTALMRVEEDGFEAAAVTAVEMWLDGAPQGPAYVDSLVFERPFAFSVVDPTSDLPLFSGWVADPSLVS